MFITQRFRKIHVCPQAPPTSSPNWFLPQKPTDGEMEIIVSWTIPNVSVIVWVSLSYRKVFSVWFVRSSASLAASWKQEPAAVASNTALINSHWLLLKHIMTILFCVITNNKSQSFLWFLWENILLVINDTYNADVFRQDITMYYYFEVIWHTVFNPGAITLGSLLWRPTYSYMVCQFFFLPITTSHALTQKSTLVFAMETRRQLWPSRAGHVSSTEVSPGWSLKFFLSHQHVPPRPNSSPCDADCRGLLLHAMFPRWCECVVDGGRWKSSCPPPPPQLLPPLTRTCTHTRTLSTHPPLCSEHPSLLPPSAHQRDQNHHRQFALHYSIRLLTLFLFLTSFTAENPLAPCKAKHVKKWQYEYVTVAHTPKQATFL